METINRQQLVDLIEGGQPARLVMTLGPNRFAQAHIPGSETFASIESALTELDPNDDIVLYCTGGTCPSTIWGYRILTGRGYQRVRVYRGGLADWHAAGLPIANETIEVTI